MQLNRVKIDITFKDGTKDVVISSARYKDEGIKFAQNYIFDYTHNEENKQVERFDVRVNDYKWTYKPTYPSGWGEPKLEVAITYIAVLKVLNIEDCKVNLSDSYQEVEKDTRSELTAFMKEKGYERSEYDVFVCACGWWTDNEEYCEYAYGKTREKARRAIVKQMKR